MKLDIRKKTVADYVDIAQRIYYLAAFAATVRSLFTPKGRWDQLGFFYVILLNVWNVTSFSYFGILIPAFIEKNNSPKRKLLFLLTCASHLFMLASTACSTYSSSKDFTHNKETFWKSDATLGDERTLFLNSFSYFISMGMMAINSLEDYPDTQNDRPLQPREDTALRIYKALADGTCSASALFSALSVYYFQREMLISSTVFCGITTAMNMAMATARALNPNIHPTEADLKLFKPFFGELLKDPQADPLITV